MVYIYSRGGYLYLGATGRHLTWRPNDDERRWMRRFTPEMNKSTVQMHTRIMPSTSPLQYRDGLFQLETPLGLMELQPSELGRIEHLLQLGCWSPEKVVVGSVPSSSSKSLYVVGRTPPSISPSYLKQEIERPDQLDGELTSVDWWHICYDGQSQLPQLSRETIHLTISAQVYLHVEVPIQTPVAPIVRLCDPISLVGVQCRHLLLDMHQVMLNEVPVSVQVVSYLREKGDRYPREHLARRGTHWVRLDGNVRMDRLEIVLWHPEMELYISGRSGYPEAIFVLSGHLPKSVAGRYIHSRTLYTGTVYRR